MPVEFARKSPGWTVVWSTVLRRERSAAAVERAAVSSVEGVLVESVEVSDTVVRIEARTTTGRAACPGCGCWSGRIHGSYLRFPRDLPTAGKLVVVSLRVRRFVCAEDCCPRKTFTEQVPGLTRRFARRTERLRSTRSGVRSTRPGCARGGACARRCPGQSCW
ncbi:transposase family protein [Streptomyces mirabilis]|uniref:transposase family protein n=1 Tax=Streptomyces mirabilis TaxID=68239 RepID=UPI00363DE2DA